MIAFVRIAFECMYICWGGKKQMSTAFSGQKIWQDKGQKPYTAPKVIPTSKLAATLMEY